MDTKNIIDIETDGVDTRDYPDFCDAFIMSAIWKDSGVSLTEVELDELNSNHSGFVHETVIKELF